jgi:hypothetical protein
LASDPFTRLAVFDAMPDAVVLLDPEQRVLDANPAYLAALGRTLDEVVGRPAASLVEPREEDPESGERLLAGYAEVARTGRPWRMGVSRYDVADPTSPDPAGLQRRYWSVEVTPLRDGSGELAALLHRARDVTAVHEQLLRTMAVQRELTGPEGARALDDDALRSAGTDTVAAALATEVEQLREAMASRAGIEQAKGVLMGEHGIGPDEAFALLAKLSQDSNRKLRDVAAALLDSVRTAPSAAPRA